LEVQLTTISRRKAILVTAGALGFLPTAASAQADAAALAKKLLAAAPDHGEKTMGDPKAPITMVEYASATCPHCAEFHNTIMPEIKRDYIDTGKVFLVFREMPLDNLALGAFMLARCVPEDKYFAAIELMFRQQSTWAKTNPKEELFKIVSMAGLDATGAEACTKKEDLAKAIYETGKRGNEEFGVKGTPTFFVNGTYLDAHDDLSAVKTALDAELAKLGAN
jgi:protein-disulfide isomerase